MPKRLKKRFSKRRRGKEKKEKAELHRKICLELFVYQRRRAGSQLCIHSGVTANLNTPFTREWLNVPTRSKSPPLPIICQKIVDEVKDEEEEEELSDEPVVIRGGRANLLDIKVSAIIKECFP